MKRFFLHLSIILLGGLIFWPFKSTQASNPDLNSFPRLANYFLHWQLDDEKAQALAKWDVLVLDMETQVTSRAQLEKIRSLNPDIVLLAYISSQEIMSDAAYLPSNSLRQKLLSNIYPAWWLKDLNGQKVSFWPGTAMLNLSDGAGLSDLGQRFNDYLPQFVAREIKSSGLWDGVFYDNLWGDICWLKSGSLDLNNNRTALSCAEINRAWSEGVKKMLVNSRELLGDEFVIAGNGQAYLPYTPNLNGLMLENFPPAWEHNGEWSASFSNYLKLNEQVSRRPQINIINRSVERFDNYSSARFGLANALLGDAYYSADKNLSDHGQTWWYDEYDVDLGVPRSKAYNLLSSDSKVQPGFWRRDFSNGLTLVNSSAQEQKLLFGKEELERIKGSQDPQVNDGTKVTWIKLKPGEGIILLKSGAEILGSNFNNGNFVRVYNDRGQSVKNGFFAYLPNFPGDQDLLSFHQGSDLVNIISRQGAIEVYRQGKLVKKFYPFTKKNIAIAFSYNQDKIVAVAGQQLRVFNLEGKLLGLFAIKAKGDLSLASAGDRIAVASRDPSVYIYDFQGNLQSEILAYDKKWTGGINVALGDINQDGRLELVTAPRAGGNSQIRIFNEGGRLLGQFLAYDKNFRKGVRPSLSDINHDGRLEILAGIKNF
ncbi:MAG: putative glycoside hydrolase [Patescibacteria group bacterium]